MRGTHFTLSGLLLVAVCVAVATANAASSKRTCSSYYIIDSRGSGVKNLYQISSPGRVFIGEFKVLARQTTIQAVANPYPAVGILPTFKREMTQLSVSSAKILAYADAIRDGLNGLGALTRIKQIGAYHDSVLEGEKNLKKMIEGEISSCPSTRIVLDGYSQGAQVTGDVYQSLTFSQRRHIFGVVLFGDPRYNHSSVTDMAKRDNNGILPVRDKFPRDSRGKVLSYCHAQDPVCQGLGQFVLHGSGAHKTYAKTHEPEEAADQLMSKSPSPSSGGLAPVLVTAPQISGTRSLQGIPLALVGNQLSVNDGAWNGNPTSFSYQWYRCDSPADQREFDNCRPIDKALAANYTLATADLGHTIQVKVVAKNASGSTATYGYTHTNYTQTPGLFGNVGAPNPIADDFWADINGTRCTGACTMNPGDVVTAHPGSWDGQGGSAAITFHYQWQSCTTPGEDCSDIPGATNASYSKKASDRWLRVDIYGSNAYGANGLYW